MAVTIWGSASSATFERLQSGAYVSVAVVGTALKWKREKRDGSWPTDGEAVTIAASGVTGVFTILILPSGWILIGNPVIGQFWLVKTSNPTNSNQFQVVTVLQ